nr:uncharacterized protein MAL13P1.304-like [Onthophagus taurus]
MTIIEELQLLLVEIKSFKTNILKDNKERRKNLESTQKRLNELNKFRVRLESLNIELKRDTSNVDKIEDIKYYSSGIDNIVLEIQGILDDRLTINSEALEISMGENFDLKTAGSLLPLMDGKEETTKQLIDSIELYSELLNADGKKLLINYVLKTRLSGNAKVRLNKKYDTVETLVRDIRENFTTRKSATTLSNQLHNSLQQSKTVDDFGRDIEQLLTDLTFAQAGDDENLLSSLRIVNEKLAINSFCNGLKNHELRTILKARNCKTLKDAINVALDEEINKPSSSTVFQMNGRGNQIRRTNFRNSRPFNGYNRNNRGNNNCVPHNNNRGFNNFNSHNNNRGNYAEFRNNDRGSQRGSYRSRGNFRGHRGISGSFRRNRIEK